MSTDNQKQERSDFLKMQIAESINIYKHHQELFLKWIGVYGAVIAAVSIYLFHAELTPYAKRLIPVLISLGSLVVALGCFTMWTWIKSLEERVRQMSEELGVAPAPFFGGKKLIFLMLFVVTGAFFLGGFVLFQWESIFK